MGDQNKPGKDGGLPNTLPESGVSTTPIPSQKEGSELAENSTKTDLRSFMEYGNKSEVSTKTDLRSFMDNGNKSEAPEQTQTSKTLIMGETSTKTDLRSFMEYPEKQPSKTPEISKKPQPSVTPEADPEEHTNLDSFMDAVLDKKAAEKDKKSAPPKPTKGTKPSKPAQKAKPTEASKAADALRIEVGAERVRQKRPSNYCAICSFIFSLAFFITSVACFSFVAITGSVKGISRLDFYPHNLTIVPSK
uniref:Uncharacterized protein n=1 Tax=Steinernema glaseri TaxID=37863 RepID=A0A1I7XVX9_9BILA